VGDEKSEETRERTNGYVPCDCMCLGIYKTVRDIKAVEEAGTTVLASNQGAQRWDCLVNVS